MKILIVFGTRPEVIKLAPFIKEVELDPECIGITCATTQQRELQNDVLHLFKIIPDYDLNVMLNGQDLFHVTQSVLNKIQPILEKENPDYIVVQGDTTTAFSAALSGFYQKIPVVHIEAGLRTGNIFSPFPEEANRKLISHLATLHLTPTRQSKENLLKEGVVNNVHVVGNTIVDSVYWGLENFKVQDYFVSQVIADHRQKVLITAHRRENFGESLVKICVAVKELCLLYPSCVFIWPVHPNPNVNSVVHSLLGNISNLNVINPLAYSDLIILINSCSLIISDSGGIQEEAAILGKKIIILREETERMEIVDAGIGVLVGCDQNKIIGEFGKLIAVSNINFDESTSNIYGCRGVSKNILNHIKRHYKECL